MYGRRWIARRAARADISRMPIRLGRFSLGAALALALAPAAGHAQSERGTAGWNDSATTALVERAVVRRERQLADTGLVDTKSRAHGYLTFLAQLGSSAGDVTPEQRFPEPPKVVKADEIEVEVYWRAPNRSKQVIVGRRDSLLLPTDINYHRDHLAILQNNFPSTIRLGDGDEVLDVPHPLSRAGLAEYDYAVRDSSLIRTGTRTITVLEVRVRPRDDRQPRAVGAVYIERDEAQVVRLALSFTRAALKDKELEDVSVVLENGLVNDRFWLPRRQEIEIRRTGSWLDYPARGIIRGRWEISDYEINTNIPLSMFAGPEIVQVPIAQQRQYPFGGRILDSLPSDVRAATDADVQAVQDEARALVRAEALSRSRTLSLSARSVSDFVRVNRVEGIALGGGLTRRLGGGVSVAVGGRFGTDDHAGKGRLALGWQRASGVGAQLFAARLYRDAGDVQETSLLRNSLAAQEFGADYTDPYDVRAAGLGLSFGDHFGARWSAGAAYESQGALAVHARSAAGDYESTIPALALHGVRGTLSATRATAPAPLGFDLSASAELRALRFTPREDGAIVSAHTVGRLFAQAHGERAAGGERRLVLDATLATTTGAAVPAQELVYLGGPVSAPGYDYHAFAGHTGASARAELRLPVPFPTLTLGRFGRVPARATLAPFANAIYVDRPAALPGRRAYDAGVYPSLGIGALSLFDLLRVDVARGLRDGRWTFSLDIGRDFWSVL